MVKRRDFLRSSAVVATAVFGGRPMGLHGGAAHAVASSGPTGLGWGAFTEQMRPWTRWWWLGSAVTEQGLQRHLRDFADVGLGGVEIQPIYEAQGNEDEIRTFLSPEWVAALDATTRSAHDVGLSVDLTAGSGWTFGGPWTTPELSAGQAFVEQWTLGEGERLAVEVRTDQPPHPPLRAEERLSRPDLRPPMPALPEPPLAALVARDLDSGTTIDLTGAVRPDRTLDWTAPAGRWELTAVFSGLVLVRVERAGPGGRGLMLDHFNLASVLNHLNAVGGAIGGAPRGIRALFHDSFENYKTDWTPDVLEDFRRLRGYDLVPHIPEVFTDAGEAGVRSRVLSDVRETFSDLFVEQFAVPWTEWSAERGWLTRNQAHGSPANLLDVYGAASIPETEYSGGMNVPVPGLRVGPGATPPRSVAWRFASSPAHVQGGPLVSAEALTWLDEHYHVSLSQAKPAVDVLFAAGINHIFFHGTAYSDYDASWPGTSFYASTELKPANPVWRDLPELTSYIARCQSVLQTGQHGNDVLLYWPQHDLWAEEDARDDRRRDAPEYELTPNLAWAGRWVYNHPSGTGDIAAGLERRGWQYDWVSDRQLDGFEASPGAVANAHSRYATVVVPGARLVPLPTMQKLHDLAHAGATVVFVGGLPEDVPGLGDLDARRARLAELRTALTGGPDGATPGRYQVGRGHAVLTAQGADPDDALAAAGAVREPVADSGVRVLRRRHDHGWHYFLSNVTADTVQGWWSLGHDAASVGLLDPVQDLQGLADTRRHGRAVQVRLHLEPGESRILRSFERTQLDAPAFPDLEPAGRRRPLPGRWRVEFLEGGPVLPEPRRLVRLVSWTELGPEAAAFSGTARYTLEFTMSGAADRDWVLDLGDVRESSRVRLNGVELNTAWALPFRVVVGDALVDGRNLLELEVTNLAANRVRDLARRGELDLDFFMNWRTTPPARWDPMPSGLLGPVALLDVGGRSR